MSDEVRREHSRQCLIDEIRWCTWIAQIDLAQLEGSFFCLIYNLSQHPLCALVSSSIECDQSHRILNRFLILWLNKISINIVTGGSAGKESACQCRRQETQFWSLGGEVLLKKETATHSSIPAQEIPWIEEPGGLQSMGASESDTT